MARKTTAKKKTASKKTAKKKTTRKKPAKKKTARKTTARKTTRRKKHYPKVAKHGKTPAERRKYIKYREDVDAVKKKHYG